MNITPQQKTWRDLSDNEKRAIREYRSWVRSDAPFEYKLRMIEAGAKRLVELGIFTLR